MKCSKCKKKNVTQASFCRYCGNAFTKEEKEIASKKNWTNTYLKIRDWYDTLTLSNITGDYRFKILLILITLIIAFLNIYKDGFALKINDSDFYRKEYSSVNKTYYIYSKEEKTYIDLFMPYETDKIYVFHYNEENNLIEEKIYNKDENIEIYSNISNHNYYIIAMNEEKNKENEIIKVYPYLEEVNKNE